jgi:hypothetical protein
MARHAVADRIGGLSLAYNMRGTHDASIIFTHP